MPPVVKYVVIAMLIMIVASLGYALFQMATKRQGDDSTAMVK
ncbi:MAG: Tfp pilus assembly protein PilV, partial [Gammaproteobacteria bacterium]